MSKLVYIYIYFLISYLTIIEPELSKINSFAEGILPIVEIEKEPEEVKQKACKAIR